MQTVRTLSGCFLALLVSLSAGCKSPYPDIQIDTETNPKVNFEGYTTYAWAAAAAAVRDPEARWHAPDLDIGAEIIHLVNREMRDRDMSEVVENPDVLVMYAVGVDMESLDLITDPEDGTERIENVPKGAVAVVLADPETRRVMWVGSATAEIVEEPSIELAKKRLDHAISKMFEESPL